MCGICGIVNFEKEIDNSIIDKMLDAIVHRGPDDYGKLGGKNFVAGMRRLSIIDLAGGHQPIYNEDKTVFTFFNGEIYNFIELRQNLESKGHVFSTHSDTEVIVHLYEEYGVEFIDHLNGMFGIFLADLKKDQFYLIRDHFGIKPMYYSFNQSIIVFGSELKSILKSGLISTQISSDAVFNYFNYLYIPSPQTIFKNISKLEAGHYLKISRGKIENVKWYDLQTAVKTDLRDKAEIAQDLKSLLIDSVRLQMRSDVPVGAYLSGGVDSSLMVALASQNTSLPLNTFSVGFENSEFDELPYARQVAKLFNTNHHEIIVSPKDALDSLSNLLWYMDEPIGDSAVLPSYLVSKLAAKHVKVALSGLGGDELFGGYDRYKPVRSKFELIAGMPKPLLRLLAPVLELVNANYGNEIEKLINPLSEAQKYHNQVRQMSLSMINQLTGKNHYFSAYGKEIIDTFNSYKGNDIPNQKMFTDCNRYMNDQLLHLADRTSMAVSLEARVPFLDPRIVSFASNIPSDLKVNKYDTKIILKEAIKDLLPHSILYRQKWGFAAPHKTWILSDMLQELISQTINGNLVNDGVLDKNGVAAFLNDKESVRKHSTWVWPILALELWYKQYKKLL